MSTVVDMFRHDETPQADPEAFERFWRAYPRKVGKPLAKAKFDAITGPGLKTRTLDKDSGMYVDIELHATAEELIAGAERYREAMFDRSTYRFKDDGKYLCHPSTWLNQGRWMDGA